MREVFLLFALSVSLFAQSPKEIRAMARDGPSAIPKLQELLRSPETSTRVEAVKTITEISGAASIDPLILATQDSDPEIQIRAAGGLVNVYLPGYARTSAGSSLRRAGNNLKAKFIDTNDRTIDRYVIVRPDVIQALGKLARGGASMDSRANAARAIGVLRGAAALPDLIEALRTKDGNVLYECLIAMQKIGDESAGPKIRYLLHDLDQRVQLAAIETAGILRDRGALGDLKNLVKEARDGARDNKVKRAALTAAAMMPDLANRDLYSTYLRDRDERLRASAAEGFARLRNPADAPMLQQAYDDEAKNSPRLSLAFALVMDGKTETSEYSPLRYLVNSLNSIAYRGEAIPFLIEAARERVVRDSLYDSLETGTKDEKIQLAKILAISGDRNTIPHLEKVSRDKDEQIAAEGLRALRNLQARLGKTTTSS
ncbi:MAG: HEAT repeat domain-containing protein [Acidobacteriota bacterium]|nr:HEAT repeat domain-containing protein [Acidobacteriota bacterium]